jgi:hypothetical protein
MEVAGVNKITLYENKGVVLTRDVANINTLNEIESAGTVDIFDYCVDVDFSSELSNGLNYTQLKKDSISFYIQDFNKANRQLIERFQNNKCGYLANVEYESGLNILINNPLFFEETEKEFNKNSFVMTLSYKKETESDYLEFLDTSDLVLFTTDQTTVKQVGITCFFASGTTEINWGDGTIDPMVSGVEVLHDYISGRNYEGEITNAKNITQLRGRSSSIKSIETSNLINCTYIDLFDNLLTKFNTSNLQNLTYLGLIYNNLSNIDTSTLTNLQTLFIHSNSNLDGINTDNLTNTTNLVAIFCGFTESQMDSIIIGFVNNGKLNGSITFRSGNTAPSATSEADAVILQGRGWIVS